MQRLRRMLSHLPNHSPLRLWRHDSHHPSLTLPDLFLAEAPVVFRRTASESFFWQFSNPCPVLDANIEPDGQNPAETPHDFALNGVEHVLKQRRQVSARGVSELCWRTVSAATAPILLIWVYDLLVPQLRPRVLSQNSWTGWECALVPLLLHPRICLISMRYCRILSWSDVQKWTGKPLNFLPRFIGKLSWNSCLHLNGNRMKKKYMNAIRKIS